MSASDDYCDFCDLPKSQCPHGQPPPPPQELAVKPAPRASRARTTPVRAAAAPPKVVNRRWTPPEVFKPLIVSVLEQAGGQLDTDELFLELEALAEDQLRPGDLESTPEGELRWRYAARRARAALIADGVMTKSTPGVWLLS